MSGNDFEFLIASQKRVRSLLTELFQASPEISGVIEIGSIPNERSDLYSDCDFYVYMKGVPWAQEEFDEVLRQAGLTVGAHYWTGLEKHRLVIEGVRADISLWPEYRIRDIEFWPEVFFNGESILKDVDLQIRMSLSKRKNSSMTYIERNDRDAFIVNLFNASVQCIRGEVLNAKSRATGLIESKARLKRTLRTGSLGWREPSRHAEQELARPELIALYRLAFNPSGTVFREWLLTELLELATQWDIDSETRRLAAVYAKRLGEMPAHDFSDLT
jgi:hypothetical protein